MSKILFISGIPTAGKSHLARIVAEKTAAKHIGTDSLRSRITDPEGKKWVDFYRNLDETRYYAETTADFQWSHLREQTEHIWPFISDMIKEKQEKYGDLVVEGVSLFPELIYKDFGVTGIMLLGDSEQAVLQRIIDYPRWPKDLASQKLQAKAFFEIERPKYEEMARKYGWEIFCNSEGAIDTCVNYFKESK